MERNDRPAAIATWTKLRGLLPPDSPQAARSMRHGAGRRVDESPARRNRRTAPHPPGKSVAGRVEVDPKLAKNVSPDDTVFIFARDPGRRPHAARAMKCAAPTCRAPFALTDEMAMSPAATISRAGKIVIEARVSKSGDVKPQAGDPRRTAAAVAPGATDVRVTIDRIFPDGMLASGNARSDSTSRHGSGPPCSSTLSACASSGAPSCSSTGRNGSARQTLLRILAGLTQPEEGPRTIQRQQPSMRCARRMASPGPRRRAQGRVDGREKHARLGRARRRERRTDERCARRTRRRRTLSAARELRRVHCPRQRLRVGTARLALCCRARLWQLDEPRRRSMRRDLRCSPDLGRATLRAGGAGCGSDAASRWTCSPIVTDSYALP
jgi:hypothetical protein